MQKSINQFMEELSSKAPVPGGGSVSALVGMLSAALGNMVLNLTIGKKKYAEFEEENIQANEQLLEKQKKFKKIYEQDIEKYSLLSSAYKIKSPNEEEEIVKKEEINELTLETIKPPMSAIETCIETLRILEKLLNKTTKLAVSDIGVSVACAKACIEGSVLNVMINTKSLHDRDEALRINEYIKNQAKIGKNLAENIYNQVLDKLM